MKKILLVEDNETIVMGLKYSLEQENFQVISAKSVAESREKIKPKQAQYRNEYQNNICKNPSGMYSYS